MLLKIICLVLLLSSTISTQAQVLAQFRGPARDGCFPDKNLLSSWPAEGPAVIWGNLDIGNGYGPPAVTDSKIFVTGEIDSIAYLFAFDTKGTLLRKTALGKEWVVSYPGSRSTPTVVGNLIYVTTGLGDLYCFDAADGSKLWSIDMRKDLHGRFTMFGHAESPLVVDEQVFMTPGGVDTNVVSLNRFTGKINWICKGKGEIPGYNSPILIKLPSINILVTFSAYHMLGIDAQSGELLWSHEQVNTLPDDRKPGMGDTHSNSVYYEDGFIYYIAGDGNCGVKLKLSEDGRQITKVWQNMKVDNYMGGFIKAGNFIYVGSDSKKSLLTVDATTGKVLDSLKIGNGSLAFADNKLIYYTQRGEMKLINPLPGKAEVISSFKITEGTKEHFSHPVIKNGVLYLRHGKAIFAYDIHKP